MGLKRKQITNETKLEIIENKDKLSPTELSCKYNLAPSTISTIFANKDKIIQHFENNNIKNDNKRLRLGTYFKK